MSPRQLSCHLYFNFIIIQSLNIIKLFSLRFLASFNKLKCARKVKENGGMFLIFHLLLYLCI